MTKIRHSLTWAVSRNKAAEDCRQGADERLQYKVSMLGLRFLPHGQNHGPMLQMAKDHSLKDAKA